MPRSGRKKRRITCFPSCFAAPAVCDAGESDFPPENSAMTYLTRIPDQSRTVPAAEIAVDAGEESGEMQNEDSSAVLSAAGNRQKGLTLKPGKEKPSKSTVQSPAIVPSSGRTHTKTEPQQTIIYHVSSKAGQLHLVRSSVRTKYRASQPGSPQPNETAGLATPARSRRRFDALAGLLVVAAAMTVMLFFGRLFAVLCSCTWLYLLSCCRPPPSQSPPVSAEEINQVAEIDVDSPEYKKKVVLMGLLERNRLPMTPMASPSPAKLRQSW